MDFIDTSLPLTKEMADAFHDQLVELHGPKPVTFHHKEAENSSYVNFGIPGGVLNYTLWRVNEELAFAANILTKELGHTHLLHVGRELLPDSDTAEWQVVLEGTAEFVDMLRTHMAGLAAVLTQTREALMIPGGTDGD